MHHPTDKTADTVTFVTPAVEHWLEREIAQWVHHEGSIQRPDTPGVNVLPCLQSDRDKEIFHHIFRKWDIAEC